MWGMVGEVLRDDAHGRMEKVLEIELYSMRSQMLRIIHRIELCLLMTVESILSDCNLCCSTSLPTAVCIYLTMVIASSKLI